MAVNMNASVIAIMAVSRLGTSLEPVLALPQAARTAGPACPAGPFLARGSD